MNENLNNESISRIRDIGLYNEHEIRGILMEVNRHNSMSMLTKVMSIGFTRYVTDNNRFGHMTTTIYPMLDVIFEIPSDGEHMSDWKEEEYHIIMDNRYVYIIKRKADNGKYYWKVCFTCVAIDWQGNLSDYSRYYGRLDLEIIQLRDRVKHKLLKIKERWNANTETVNRLTRLSMATPSL